MLTKMRRSDSSPAGTSWPGPAVPRACSLRVAADFCCPSILVLNNFNRSSSSFTRPAICGIQREDRP